MHARSSPVLSISRSRFCTAMRMSPPSPDDPYPWINLMTSRRSVRAVATARCITANASSTRGIPSFKLIAEIVPARRDVLLRDLIVVPSGCFATVVSCSASVVVLGFLGPLALWVVLMQKVEGCLGERTGFFVGTAEPSRAHREIKGLWHQRIFWTFFPTRNTLLREVVGSCSQ